LLGVEKSRVAIPDIAEMLSDSDEKASRWAGECLGTFGEEAYPILMEKTKDKNPRARAMSWVGLTGLGTASIKHPKEYAQALEASLKDEDLTTRQLAAESFYTYNAYAPDAFPVVVAALDNNEDPRVLCSLIAGLQSLSKEQLKKVEGAVPRLKVLTNSQNSDVKNVSTGLLVIMGKIEKGPELNDPRKSR
jgi:HEAT repeat protein